MTHKEPLIRIAKRGDISRPRAYLIRLIAVLLSLIVCGVFIYAITKVNPVEVYKSMFDGAFGTSRRIWNTTRDTMILLAVALAVTPAFKMKFWNIGAEGQILAGGLCCAAVMRYMGDGAPAPALFGMMIAAAVIGGMVWAIIPAYFKAVRNTNETLFTLMMNYIAIQFTAFFCIKWEQLKGSGTIGVINSDSHAGWISSDFMSGIFGKPNYSINLFVVLALTVLMAVYLKRTKHGYEISVVGESENTARYAGINVRAVILRTMALSGALAGFAGFLLVSGSSHTISVNTASGRGFIAIIVSWLAKFNPFIMIVISLLLVFLDNGTVQIATKFGLNASAAEIIKGTILFFLIGCEFFINYRVIFRHRREEA